MQGKVALVTGGTRGIGKAIVDALAASGCKVVFTYHSSSEIAQQIESKAKEAGQEVFGYKADASDFLAAEACIQFVLEKFSRLDILVNNAGITKDNLLLRMNETEFDVVINANLKSVFSYCKHALKPMLSQRSGRIINISSVVGINGNPGQSNYCASKAGVIGFTKSLAKEIGSRSITANVIAPGFIATDMTDKLNDKQKETIISQIPLKRIGAADDIAKAVVFLASDYSSYMTGQTLVIDGGLVM
ncbi:MAG: 3-oxoacyl-[acyl-carrier-protein] reductase [Ignavibacteriales bacterium]|nr:3-oxoacyl-[acyl-carrier-protein] reductase [Ignavibacteriales bacterium]